MKGHRTFDVIVVGASIAGTSAAIALRSFDLKVGLVNSHGLMRFAVGDSVLSDIRPELMRLGLWDSFEADGHDAAPQLAMAWGSPILGIHHEFLKKDSPAWQLDRRAFKERLLDRARQVGVDLLIPMRAVSFRLRPGGSSSLVLQHGSGNLIRIESRFLVDATGHWSAIARMAGAVRSKIDSQVAAYSVFRPAQSELPTLIETEQDGWWHASQLLDGRAIITFYSDDDVLVDSGRHLMQGWLDGLSRTTHVSCYLEAAEGSSRLSICQARTGRLRPVAGPGWLAVGDAAGTRNPLSFSGIAQALRSGLAAGETVKNYLEGEESALQKYDRATQEALDRDMANDRLPYLLENRWPKAPYWARRR